MKKIQNLTKFRRYGPFFCQNFLFTANKWCSCARNIFWVSKFLGNLQICPKLQKTKFWPNSAVKRKIVGFLKMNPKKKLYAERRYDPFFCQKFFSQSKSDAFAREIFFGCRNFWGTSKFAPFFQKAIMWKKVNIKGHNVEKGERWTFFGAIIFLCSFKAFFC